jgi:hypothetical protein
MAVKEQLRPEPWGGPSDRLGARRVVPTPEVERRQLVQ